MIISPINGSTRQRTRNRLRDHGPEFEIIDESSSVPSLGDIPGYLIWSTRTDWYGWVPKHEVVVDRNGWG